MLEKQILKLPEFQKKVNEKNKKNNLEISNSFFKNEEEMYKYIEGLPTIQKIFIVQNLLKEMKSIKFRFEENKDKMKEKIDLNSFKYFKNKILIKEIYDYCQEDNVEDPIKYTLLKNANEILTNYEEVRKDFIEKFFFDLRNNNALMIKIVENIDQKYYKQLSYFMVHFLYENPTCCSFEQDELMIITYLVIENFVNKILPKILNQKNSNNFFKQKEKPLFLYHYLKAFTQKTEIRNYLISILEDIILLIENENKVFSLNIRTIHKNISEEDVEKERMSNVIKKKYSIVDENIDNIKGDKFLHQSNNLSKKAFDNLIQESAKVRHSVGYININKQTNNNNNNDIIRNLDLFFKQNNFTQIYLSQLLSSLNNNNEKTELDMSYMEYLLLLKEQIQTKDNQEIFSSSIIFDGLKEAKKGKDNIGLEEIANIFKENFYKIINFIEDIIQKISDNIKSLPYTIKCIYYMFSTLIDIKFPKKPGRSIFKNLMMKSRFFLGGLIMPVLANPLYNGIISDNIISKSTKENLNIIFLIFDKMLSGNLFNIMKPEIGVDPSLIIFNKYITQKIPIIFDIINNIDKYLETNFESPSFILDLISSNDKIDDIKRNINYNYFLINKDDNIRYQSICFSSGDLNMLVKAIKQSDSNSKAIKQSNSNLNTKTEEELNIELLKKYAILFEQRYENNKNNKKEEYIFLSKFVYKESFLNEIKSVTEDHLENYFKVEKRKVKDSFIEEIMRFKKCLMEILMYLNKLHKENFNPFIKRKDELFLCNNSKVNQLFNYRKIYLYNDVVFEGEKRYSVNSLTGSFHSKRELKKALAEDNSEDADFFKEIFPRIISSTKYEIGYNFDNPNLEKIIFCVSYLQIHIKDLPLSYAKDNYSKLFIDIMKDAENLIKSLQNNILKPFYLKLREGDKLNLIISNYSSKIKNMEKYYCIGYLFSKIKLPDPFEYELGAGRTQTVCVNDLASFLTPESISISSFILRFPDYRKNEKEIDDIIEEENSKDIPNILNKYFKDIKNLVKKEKIISKYSSDELWSIGIELENYILHRLYDKIYPKLESNKDKFIYKKCSRLSFIKQQNYIKDNIKISENLINIAIEYINKMDQKHTPVDKIKMFGKAFGLLQNSMTFSCGKSELGIDDILPLLIYVILKSKPKMINTNYNFCKYYINPELEKKQYGILLIQIGMAIKVICEMKYTDFIGITEEQFGNDKEEPPHIRRSKNLEAKF